MGVLGSVLLSNDVDDSEKLGIIEDTVAEGMPLNVKSGVLLGGVFTGALLNTIDDGVAENTGEERIVENTPMLVRDPVLDVSVIDDRIEPLITVR